MAATEPIPNMVDMVERLGLAIGLVIFFTVTGWYRENRMAKRLDALEEDNRRLGIENAKLSEKIVTLTDQVTEALQRDTQVITDAIKVLGLRTCWAFNSRDDFETFKETLNQAD